MVKVGEVRGDQEYEVLDDDKWHEFEFPEKCVSIDIHNKDADYAIDWAYKKGKEQPGELNPASHLVLNSPDVGFTVYLPQRLYIRRSSSASEPTVVASFQFLITKQEAAD